MRKIKSRKLEEIAHCQKRKKKKEKVRLADEKEIVHCQTRKRKKKERN